jgi:hypothetical protein
MPARSESELRFFRQFKKTFTPPEWKVWAEGKSFKESAPAWVKLDWNRKFIDRDGTGFQVFPDALVTGLYGDPGDPRRKDFTLVVEYKNGPLNDQVSKEIADRKTKEMKSHCWKHRITGKTKIHLLQSVDWSNAFEKFVLVSKQLPEGYYLVLVNEKYYGKHFNYADGKTEQQRLNEAGIMAVSPLDLKKILPLVKNSFKWISKSEFERHRGKGTKLHLPR